MENRLIEVEKTIASHQAKIKELYKRTDKNEGDIDMIYPLMSQMATVSNDLVHITNQIKEVIEAVETLQRDKNENYKYIVMTFLGAVLGVVGGYLGGVLVGK